MLHGNVLPDGIIVICPILLTITFVFTRFTFRPSLSSALFHPLCFSCSSALLSAIKTMSLTYNISCNMSSFISLVATSTTMANNGGDKTDPWCTPTFTSSSSDKCVPTFTLIFAQAHYCCNKYAWNIFLPHCQFLCFPRNYVKCLFQIFIVHVQRLLFSLVFFLYSPQNESCINCTFSWHKAELHIIHRYNFSHSFLRYVFNNFHCMS